MSNTLNLGITLKADGSGLVGELKVTEKQLKKLDTGLKNTDKDAKKASRSMRSMNKSMGMLRAGTSGLSRGLFSLNGLFAGLSLIGVSASFLKAARSTENYKARLNILLGSQHEGNKLFQEMTELAARVPQSYDEIMASATNLAGVMEGGVEEISQWMPMIADLAAASGLSVEEATGQVIRMYSAGAGAADMFRERGVLAMLGFQSGVKYSAEETKKILIDAYEDPLSKFKGAALEQAKTWDGLLSMIGDKWFQVRTTIMDSGVFDYLKGWLSLLNDSFGEVLDNTKTEAQAWADSIISTMEGIFKAASFIGDAIHGWKVIIVGVELAWKGFLLIALDGAIALASALNSIGVGTNQGVEDLERAWREVNQEIGATRKELNDLAKTELPSDKFERLNEDIKAAAQSAAIFAEAEADVAFMMEEANAASKAQAKALDEANKKQAEATKELKEWAEAAYQKYIPAEEKILDQMFKLEEAYEKTGMSVDKFAVIQEGLNEELAKGTDELKKQPDEIFNLEEAWKQVQNNLQDGFSELFVGMFHGDYLSSIKDFGKKVLDIFLKLIADIAAAWVASKIFGGEFSLGSITGGSGAGGILGSIGKIFSGGDLVNGGGIGGGGILKTIGAKLGIGGGAAAGGTLAAPAIGTGISPVFGAGAAEMAPALQAAETAASGLTTSLGTMAGYAGAAYVAFEVMSTMLTDSPMEIAIKQTKEEFALLNEHMLVGGDHIQALGHGVTAFGEANQAVWTGFDEQLQQTFIGTGEAALSQMEALEAQLLQAGVQAQFFGNEGGQAMYKLSGNIGAAKDIISAFGNEGQSAMAGIINFTDLAGNSYEELKAKVAEMGGTINNVKGEWGEYSGQVTGSIGLMIALQNTFGSSLSSAIGSAHSLADAIGGIPNPPSVPGGQAPSHAVGSSYLRQNGLINAHQGEMVIDRQSAEVLRKYGIKSDGGGVNAALTAVLSRIEEIGKSQLETMRDTLQATEKRRSQKMALFTR